MNREPVRLDLEVEQTQDWKQHQNRFLVQILELVRLTKRTTEKTLRRQISRAIHEHFGFGYYRCGKCGRYKRRTEFHRDRARWNGIRPQCKQCLKPLWMEKYWKNRAQILKQKRLAYRGQRNKSCRPEH